MSYLDSPRINFSGTFFTDPSTMNNDVENYDSTNWSPDKTQTYWNPMGKANFILKDCTLKSIVDDSASLPSANDTLIGQSITVVANPFPGKIVDLDPQQQGCSALFGVKILIGELDGAYVVGDFETAAFRQLWNRLSSGMDGDIGMGAIYQSTLTNLVWSEGDSEYLKALKNISPERLSIKFSLDLYNGIPLIYLMNGTAIVKMQTAGVPNDVIDKLKVLEEYNMNGTPNGIPTDTYFSYLLEKYLTTEQFNAYKDDIMQAAQQPYLAGSTLDSIDMEFTQGRIVGTVGPSSADEPVRSSFCRMLSPVGQYNGINMGPLGYTPFQIGNDKVILDLANTLPNKINLVNKQKQVDGKVDLSKLGDSLDFGYYEDANFTLIKTLTGAELTNDFLMNNGGILEVPLTSEQLVKIQTTPCAVRYSNKGNNTYVLKEQEQGYYLSADKVFFRMNPGSIDKDRGATNELKVHVTQFGKKMSGVKVYATSVSPTDANNIFGPPQTATPIDALKVEPKHPIDTPLELECSVSDENGIASFTITANDPANPRGYIDGQLYYISYALDAGNLGVGNALFGQNMDGAYILVFNDTPMVDNPTWVKDIQPIMAQFGYLYPIMKTFDLGDYEAVKKYNQAILTSMKQPLDNPNHMPVTRDFSFSRLALLEKWVEKGMIKL